MKISSEIADVVWDILVDKCKATENDRSLFVRYALEADNLHQRGILPEYRFIGNFGFGGKIYLHPYKWTVSFYPEDKTQERESIKDMVNLKLTELYNRQKING